MQQLVTTRQQKRKRSSQHQPNFDLRDYQKQVIQDIYGHYRHGKKSVMLVSPTGSGKTLTSVHIIRDAINRKCRVLFIVHREPLIDQTVNTLVADTVGELNKREKIRKNQ
jgi:superfamily II DNA or RNA helicase